MGFFEWIKNHKWTWFVILFGIIFIPLLPFILFLLYFLWFLSYRDISKENNKKKGAVKEEKEHNSENPSFKCGTVYYKGGDLRHVADKGILSSVGTGGNIIGYSDKMVFSSKKFEINIPAKKIDFSKVKSRIGSRGSEQEAMAFAGAGMSFGSLGAMGKDVFIKIPFIDENGRRQEPEFEVVNSKAAEMIQKWIYEKMPRQREKQKDEKHIRILKERYARGEITKEEFKKMKNDLK